MELVPGPTITRDAAGLVYGTWKLIWDRDANYWMLFSLAEEMDLSRDEPTAFADMKRRLLEALEPRALDHLR